MQNGSTHFFQDKIILRVRNRVCNTTEELLKSELFNSVLHRCIDELKQQRSKLLGIFPSEDINEKQIEVLKQALFYLLNLPAKKVAKLVPIGCIKG